MATDDEDDLIHEREPALGADQLDVFAPPLKWLTLQRRGKLCIHSEAAAVVEAETRHVNIVVIFGSVRNGKSYLLNALLGGACFEVSSAASSCTLGADICGQLIHATHFGATENAPMVAFVDVEGHSEKGHAQEMKLSVPLCSWRRSFFCMRCALSGPPPRAFSTRFSR